MREKEVLDINYKFAQCNKQVRFALYGLLAQLSPG